MRKILKKALPEAEERISWSMPTFWKNHNILHFAVLKKHIGFYPGPKIQEAPFMNPSRELIKGVICGIRVEEVQTYPCCLLDQ